MAMNLSLTPFRCVVHEQLAAEGEARDTGNDEQETHPDAALLGGGVLLIGFVPLETQDHIADKQGDEDTAVHTAEAVGAEAEDRVFQAQDNEEHRDQDVHGDVPLPVGWGNGHREDEGRDAQDQEGVHDVRAYHVANGDIRIALEGADEADDHLRGRCAHADDGEADDELAQAEASGDARGTVHEPVRPEHDQGETADEQKDLQPDHFTFRLSAHTFSTCMVCGNMSTGWTAVIS